MSTVSRTELIRELSRAKDPRSKERLQTVFRAASGRHTLQDLAGLAGRSRSTIQIWIDKFTREGIAGLLERDAPPGSSSPIGAANVRAELQAGLTAGRWRTATEVAAWLKDAHGIERSRKSMYYWISKAGRSAARTSPVFR